MAIDVTAAGRDEKRGQLPACALVRQIGKAPASWTIDDLVDVSRHIGIRLVSLKHVGGDGWLKTLDFVPRDVLHLRDVLAGGERADGSSLFGSLGVTASASDVVLRPRIETAFVDPFAAVPALSLLCSHLGRDGRPLPESPDTIVREAHRRLRAEAGVDLQALGEVEYFLGKRPDESDIYGAAERGYHASSPFVFGEELRRRALVLLAEMGIPTKYGHSEVGYIPTGSGDDRIWEQHEIELALQPLPEAADAVVLTQWLLRNLAHQRGFRCSFEPILLKGHAGSGMHFHLSPVVDGEHQPVLTPEGRPVGPAAWIIGGLVSSAGGLMAFGNRAANSFVRLTQAKEAPDSIRWGRFNRRALVRLPVVASDAAGHPVSHETVEFRLPDGSAHPHLLLAGIAQAAVAGRALALDRLLDATAVTAAATTEATSVPRSFAEVAEGLRGIRPVLEAGGVFPAHVVDRVLESLRAEP